MNRTTIGAALFWLLAVANPAQPSRTCRLLCAT